MSGLNRQVVPDKGSLNSERLLTKALKCPSCTRKFHVLAEITASPTGSALSMAGRDGQTAVIGDSESCITGCSLKDYEALTRALASVWTQQAQRDNTSGLTSCIQNGTPQQTPTLPETIGFYLACEVWLKLRCFLLLRCRHQGSVSGVILTSNRWHGRVA